MMPNRFIEPHDCHRIPQITAAWCGNVAVGQFFGDFAIWHVPQDGVTGRCGFGERPRANRTLLLPMRMRRSAVRQRLGVTVRFAMVGATSRRWDLTNVFSLMQIGTVGSKNEG